MNYTDFSLQMKRLAEAFGESQQGKYEKRISIYYEQLSKLSDEQFLKTVDRLLNTAERFPTIKVILETARNFQEAPIAEEHPQCAACDSKGTVTATSKDGYRTLFRCPHCQNCVVGYPLWSEQYKQAGYKLDVKDKGWNPNDEYQIKGLAMLGPKSLAFRKAPPEMQEKAKAIMKTKGIGDLSHISEVEPFAKPDLNVESKREKNISFAENSYPEKD